MKVTHRWRVSWREHDHQGGWWAMTPREFDTYEAAERFFNRKKEHEGEYYDGATKDIKIEEIITVSRTLKP